MTRPLRPTQRTDLAATLRSIADKLESNQARDVQRILGEAATIGYPTRASTAPTTPQNRTDEDGHPIPPDTQPEAHVLNPDQTGRLANGILNDLRQLLQIAPALDIGLKMFDPNRAVALCHRCHEPLERGYSRCQRRDADGRQCGASETPTRACRICTKHMKPGEPLREGRCDACRKFHERHGHDKNTVRRIQLVSSDVITEESEAS